MNSSAINKLRNSRIDETRLWRCGETESWEPPGALRDLPARGAHAWLCPLTPGGDLASQISPEETERAKNLLPESKAGEFILSRGWLRVLLAYYLQLTEPGSIRLAIADRGKPYAPDYPELKFNLSHSYGRVAIAFSRHEVGIDIEKLRPVPDWRSLSEGLLTAEDIEEISLLAEGEREAAFLDKFAAREAHWKAGGAGAAGARLERLPEIPGGYVGHICILAAEDTSCLSRPGQAANGARLWQYLPK